MTMFFADPVDTERNSLKKINFCERRIVAIMAAFQAADAGSIPAARTC
jgi:hypothetical protein